MPVFAISFIFVVFLNPGYGLLNYLLTTIGLRSPNWLGDPAWTKIALGDRPAGRGSIRPDLAWPGSRVPLELYRSAEIDGAGAVRKFFSITLPLMTPVILYDLIIGLSLALPDLHARVHPDRWRRARGRAR